MFNKIDSKECFEKRHSITYEDKIKYCQEKGLFQMAYKPDLDNPKSLNEKIIWLALNYRNPEIKVASDKITAKDWIANRVGHDYVVPLHSTYDSVEELDLKSLPNRFVIKSNCGWAAKTVRIVQDLSAIDFQVLKAEAEEWLKPWNNYYYNNMCVGEENIKPRLLVEDLLGDGNTMIKDYKLFVFNGKAQFFYIVDDRKGHEESKTFLTLDWGPMPCHRYDVPSAAQLGKVIEKPICLEEMISVGEKLSEGFPLVRVDFYYVDGRLYVGEMTFTPGMFLSIEPREWDFELGESLALPKQ